MEIIKLPQDVIAIIASQLPVKDILNLRLACKFLNQVVLCKQVFSKIAVRLPQKASVSAFNQFVVSILGSRFVKLNLSNVYKANVLKILEKSPNLVELEISIRHLPLLSDTCADLTSLTLIDKHPSMSTHGWNQSYYNLFFKPLKIKDKLKTLCLRAPTGSRKPYYGTHFISTILRMSPTSLNTVILRRIVISVLADQEFETSVKCAELFQWCSGIKHWTFENVRFNLATDSSNPIVLPSLIESFAYYKLSFMDTYFYSSSDFTSLKRLELYSSLYLPHLRNLDTFLGLEVLKLHYCMLSVVANLPLDVVKNIHTLWLGDMKNVYGPDWVHDFENAGIIDLIHRFSKLKSLTLVGVQTLTPDFLPKINHDNLHTIIFRDCTNFLHQNSTEFTFTGFRFVVCIE